MVLSRPIGEFCLQENVRARYHAGATGSSQRLAHSGFKVMPPLIGGVDSAKAGAQRQFHESRSTFFFPGCAIQKIRDGRELFGHDAILSRSVSGIRR